MGLEVRKIYLLIIVKLCYVVRFQFLILMPPPPFKPKNYKGTIGGKMSLEARLYYLFF